jgi:hypothetical protein
MARSPSIIGSPSSLNASMREWADQTSKLLSTAGSPR